MDANDERFDSLERQIIDICERMDDMQEDSNAIAEMVYKLTRKLMDLGVIKQDPHS